jgi:hypothetical protein
MGPVAAIIRSDGEITAGWHDWGQRGRRMGHTLDLAIALLGPLADAIALATTQYPQVMVGQHKVRLARTTPDYILVQARLAAGIRYRWKWSADVPPERHRFAWR